VLYSGWKDAPRMGKSESIDAKTWALLQAIKRRMDRDPGWRVLVRERDWLCPYCGEVGVKGFRRSDAPEQVLRHLVRECTHWAEEAGTRFGLSELKARARRLETEESLRSDPAWRLADRLGHWLCPFCAEPTTVAWRPEVEETPRVEAVLRHLDACQAHQGKRRPHSPEALALIVEELDRHSELAARLRELIATDPEWRRASGDGKWLCPKCGRRVPEVDISSDLLLVSVAPLRMASHLVERCGLAETRAPQAAAPAAPSDEGAERNLERAREIVRKMLPAEVPTPEGYDLYCLYHPTERVGGDFYDYFPLSGHEVALVLGDVSGHGLEAALIMTMVKKSLKLHAQRHRSPAEVLRRTNQDINSDLDARTFVSACYAVLDARANSLTFARAGHNPPILFNPRRTPAIRHLQTRGMALGMYDGGLFDKVIEEVELAVRPGDCFILYTDGLTEARNDRDETFGLERLEAAIARTHGDLTSQALAAILFDDVRKFADGTFQDDVAILCVRCTGTGSGA